MLPSLVLVLALAPAPSDLSPEAAEYNAKAMRFHDAGQFAPAVVTLPADPPVPTPVRTAPASPPADDPTPRRLQIAGGVLVPLGLVALGVVGAVGSGYRRDLARADALHAELMTRSCTEDDRTRLRELLTATRRQEGLMIALGVTGGALITAGTALLVRGTLQRRRARLGLDLRQHRVGLTISGEF